MTDRSHERANDESRERMAGLLATLTPAQMAVDLGEGWTVASAVAHMGFWDRWQSARWQEMLAGTWSVDEAAVLVAEDLANESLHPYWSVIGGAALTALALEAASSVDAQIAQAPDSLVDSLEGGPNAFLLHRHRHRGDHLDQIWVGLAHAGTTASAAPVDRSYLQRNEASLTRLAELAARLTSAELTLRAGDGAWTVGQVLGHMAFWDRFLAARWRAALASGAESAADARAARTGRPAERRPAAHVGSLLGGGTRRDRRHGGRGASRRRHHRRPACGYSGRGHPGGAARAAGSVDPPAGASLRDRPGVDEALITCAVCLGDADERFPETLP